MLHPPRADDPAAGTRSPRRCLGPRRRLTTCISSTTRKKSGTYDIICRGRSLPPCPHAPHNYTTTKNSSSSVLKSKYRDRVASCRVGVPGSVVSFDHLRFFAFLCTGTTCMYHSYTYGCNIVFCGREPHVYCCSS